jgi:hypothetical protein
MDMASSVKDCNQKVLNVLAKSERVNILSVVQLLGEKNMIVYQAIGWLVHEGKIRYVQEGNQTYVSLAGERR